MEKILLKNKKIVFAFILIVIVFSIYFFFFHDKKQYYFCSGRNFGNTEEINDLWIFDLKNKLAYKNTMQNVPYFLEIYPDLYVFNKNDGDGSMTVKYQFYKISEKLQIEGAIKSSGNKYYSKLNCRKRS